MSDASKTREELKHEVSNLRARVANLERAEEALRESQERYRSVTEDSPGLICRFLPGGEITFVNDAYCDYFGKTRKELIGKTFLTLIPEEDRETVMANISALTVDSPTQTHEHQVIAPDGEIRWQRWTNHAMFNEQNRAVAYQSFGDDITGHKRAEEALRQSEERISGILASLADYISMIDEDMNIVFANERAKRMFGPDLLGKKCYAAYHRRSRPCESCPVIETFKDGKIHQHETAVIGADGTRFQFWCTTSVVAKDKTGHPTLVVEVSRDITDRKQVEEALKDSEARFKALVDQATDAILVHDMSGRFRDVNARACKSLQFSRDELLHMNAWDVEIGYGSPEDLKRLWQSMKPGEIYTANGTQRRKDGTTFPVEVTIGQINVQGETQILLFARDITDRIRAEKKRAVLQEQLHQAQKMEAVGQLAGGIAHDFNNLLTAISGYTQQARQALPENHKAIGALRRVEEAAEQAVGVTGALLTFSHRTPTAKKLIDLRDPVEHASRLLTRVIPATSIEIVTNLDTAPPLQVLADATQIQQIVMNLAINARDAMPQGGTLRITLSSTQPEAGQHKALLVVSDNGIGVPKELQERIFEPFFTTKPRSQGTGLGLSIIHGIIEDHNGTIDVNSETGKGTTFTIAFPLTSAETPSVPEETSGTPRRGNGELILLAEDNRHVRRIMIASLRALNYEVLPAEDGRSLLQYYDENQERIRLLVADVDLTYKDGLDCLKVIRARGGDIPAIIVTAYTDARLDNMADERTLVLRKPFHMLEFGALIGRMIEPEAHRENET